MAPYHGTVRPALFQGRALIRSSFTPLDSIRVSARRSLANNAGRAGRPRRRRGRRRRRRRAGSAASSSRAGSACAREEIRDHWEDREGGETDARHSLLARQHSDLSIDFHDRSRTGESERTQRTNGRGTKGERGTQPPRISAARHEFQTGLRAQFTCLRAVSKKGRVREVSSGGHDGKMSTGGGVTSPTARRIFRLNELLQPAKVCQPRKLRVTRGGSQEVIRR